MVLSVTACCHCCNPVQCCVFCLTCFRVCAWCDVWTLFQQYSCCLLCLCLVVFNGPRANRCPSDCQVVLQFFGERQHAGSWPSASLLLWLFLAKHHFTWNCGRSWTYQLLVLLLHVFAVHLFPLGCFLFLLFCLLLFLLFPFSVFFLFPFLL